MYGENDLRDQRQKTFEWKKFNGKGGILVALKERQDLERQKQMTDEGKEWLKPRHSDRIGYGML